MRALVAILAALTACAVEPSLSPRDCTPGVSTPCACADGRSGAQVCQGDGVMGACACLSPADAGAAPDAPAAPSDARAEAATAADALSPVRDAGAPSDSAQEAAPPVPADVPPACPPALRCGAECMVDAQTDPRHCGGCGIRCPAPPRGMVAVCAAGRCGATCLEGFVQCGSICVDPRREGFDCRRCGYQCPIGEVCRGVNADRAECVAR